MAFNLKAAGLYRANPLANSENATRLVSPDNPGTPGTDSGTVDVTGAANIQGIVYDGTFVRFSHEEHMTQRLQPYVISAASSAKEVQDAIHQLTDRREVDGIVVVTKTGSTLSITHTGAGTMSALVVDGENQSLSRSEVSAAGGVGVAATEAKGDTKSKAKKEK